MEENKKNNHSVWTVLFVLLNVGIIAYTALREFGGGGSERTALRLGASGWLWLLGGAACLAAALAAEAEKFMVMMRTLGERVSFRAAFETAVLGKYYDSITPSGVGGQPFQIWWLHRLGYSSGAAGAMPVLAFLTMQAGFILPALITFFLWRPEELEAIRYSAYAGLVLYSLVPGLLVWFSVAPKSAEKVIVWAIRLGGRLRLVKEPEETAARFLGTLEQYHGCFGLMAQHPRLPWQLLLLSILYRLALCSLPWFVLMALGGGVNYGSVLAMTVYIYAAITLLPTPGNAGAAEGSFYLVFSRTGASGVFWAMLLWRLLSYYSFLLLGALVHLFGSLGRSGRKG